MSRNKNLPFIFTCMRYNLAMLGVIAACYGFFSFTTKTFTNDFLKMIGISKTDADERVASSIIGGYVNTYGVKKIQQLATGDRLAITKDLLTYVKNYVSAEEFKKQYTALRESNKPQDNSAPDAPDKYKAKLLAQAKEAVKQTEEYMAKATTENKALFKPALEAAKKNLADMQDPKNEFLKMYSDNYPSLLKMYNEDMAGRLKTWQETYPDNANFFVKKRLEEFLAVTAHVDFSAKLKEEDGKKYFVNPVYEQKDSRWKMAFRAGKEVVETSRAFAQQWLTEIN